VITSHDFYEANSISKVPLYITVGLHLIILTIVLMYHNIFLSVLTVVIGLVTTMALVIIAVLTSPELIRERAERREFFERLRKSFDEASVAGLFRPGFITSGRLEMSRRAVGAAYRWHEPKFFGHEKEFWRTFEDGPWKWQTQQRFAGKNLNCGHFFAVTPEGASAEAAHYGIDTSKMQLLKVFGTSDAVLDLTHEDNLIKISKIAIENAETISDRTYLFEILSFMTDEYGSGGNSITDYIGQWARKAGYDGIMFFSARSIGKDTALRWQIEHGVEDTAWGNPIYDMLSNMRQRYDLINVMYFSGAHLIKNIQRYAFPADGPWEDNCFYGAADADIDKLFKYDSCFQEENSRYTLYRPEVRPMSWQERRERLPG
jgi:hypothetical protein